MCVNYLLETENTKHEHSCMYETAIFFECPDWRMTFMHVTSSDFQTSRIYIYVWTFFLPFPSETWNGSGPLDGPLPIQWPGTPASLWWKLSHGAPQRRLIQARGKRQLWLLLKHQRHDLSELPQWCQLASSSVACTPFVLSFVNGNNRKNQEKKSILIVHT